MPRNERLRQQRILRNWRQQDLADQLQTSLVTVQRWERGTHQPSAYYRAKLCELFRLSVQELGLVEEILSPPHSESTGVAVAGGVLCKEVVLWNIPYRRNPHFTGRDNLLSQLEQRFAPRDVSQAENIRRVALSQAQAIKGLGGIGKTQIAVEYAYRAREQKRYAHTCWITAASEETILTSFAALADQFSASLAKGETDQRKLAAEVINWLEQCALPWLLIFDNAEELSLLLPYLPRWGKGHILFTTRANAVGAFASALEVDTMSLMEGAQLLLRRAQRLELASDEEVNEAGNIVVALAQFPLALDQAGAYIEESGCSLHDYLQLYQLHRSAFLARRGTQATQYPESVVATWSLSFQRIEQQSPASAEMLHLLAFLSPDHIPEELLSMGAPYWPPALQLAVSDRVSFNQMLEALLRFSLVKRLSEDRQLSIHRLVQVVQREALQGKLQQQWAERVVRAVNHVFPGDPRENSAAWSLCQRYLEQAQACTLLIQQYHLQFSEAAELLDRVGIYLRERALYHLAKPLFYTALRLWKQQRKPNHAHISSSLADLGDLYREQGKYRAAELLYRRAHAIYERFVGQEGGQLAYLLQGLAILSYQRGKYTEAELLYRRVLHIWEQQVGSEHAKVCYPLNGLASLYFEQGKYGKAEPLYQRVLYIWEQQLGPEHLHVAMILSNLANLYCRQELYAQAEALHQRAQRIYEQQAGSENPRLINSLHGLAYTYQKQGRYTEAELLYHRALRIGEQHLGSEHPTLFDPLNDLAWLFLHQERYVEAEKFYMRALNVLQKQVNPEQDHPDMASPLHGLARVYAVQGNPGEAERFFQRAARLCEQKFGPVHIVMAEIQHDFAGFQQAQGQIQEAAFLYQQALTIREPVLGLNHPLTIEARENLQNVQIMLGQPKVKQPAPRKEK
ncbi:tetratricopeptide repeat protein [Reticulibacter mediterranei]|uniref:Tetratricopeptide repeat protein n=1 Tax=Reticulibacter mediterranei TaxID=2778369 RepID=A0A8J3N8Y2_9CHLR|nr:FxSxx-COOH system tetratricopeptide repeat protein [Reticulibacter mediterranei]GHP00016.1 tetratricopeptide repeat protein [Reticulibacter mediterranei]